MTCQDAPGSGVAGQDSIAILVPFAVESPGSARQSPDSGLTNSVPIGPSGLIRQSCPPEPLHVLMPTGVPLAVPEL